MQSQTLTVDRQMKRYSIPRLAFINKCDRMGANPFKCIDAMRTQLSLPAGAVQIPIGLEGAHEGVVDVISQQAVYFHGDKGDEIVRTDIPAELQEQASEVRTQLIEALADVDDEIGELFVMEEEPTEAQVCLSYKRDFFSILLYYFMWSSALESSGVLLSTL